jgi:hypothetical protein
LFSGFCDSKSSRVIYAPIEFYVTKSVISVAQCAALIAYYLHVPVDNPPLWLTEGKQRNDLLPWTIKWAREATARKVIYDASPKCFVKKEWLRLALKALAKNLENRPDATVVRFGFADDVFSIRADDDVIASAASGESWPEAITLLASELRKLPRRLPDSEVCILVSPEHLT